MNKTVLKKLPLLLVFGGSAATLTAQSDDDRQSFWNRSEVTGNWFGVRFDLDSLRLDFQVNFIGDITGNVSGGIE